MRILQLTPKPPVPAVDGGALAMNSVTESLLSAGHEVKVICIETKKHPFLPAKIDAAYKNATKIEAVFIDTSVRIASAFANLFSSSCYNVDRFYSLEFENRLTAVLQKETFDIVQLESLYMMPYFDVIRKNSKAKIVLRAHNVEAHLWNRRTLQEKNAVKKKWFAHLAKNFFTYETAAFTKVDGILPITAEDEHTINDMTKVRSNTMEVLPFAMRLPENITEKKPKPFSVFHIGAMDWQPNIEGVSWLVSEVWPKVLASVPHAELHLAGRDFPTGEARFEGKNIFIHGEISNAFEFMNEYAIMTVPLLTGGGMRVKLVEGMALGKPIVTTSIGAEGTAAENEKQLMIKNTAADFAIAICQLLNNEIYARELGHRAKDFAKTHFDSDIASKKLTDFYSSILK
ncbi:MAG: glycosyltransferase family 4 protein [Bacteroidia bacterium]